MNIFKRIFRKPIKVGDLVEFEVGSEKKKIVGFVIKIEIHEDPYFSPGALIEILEGFEEPYYHRIWKMKNPQLERLHPSRATWVPLDKCKKFKIKKYDLKFCIGFTMAMLMVSVFLYFYLPVERNHIPFLLNLFICFCVGGTIGQISGFLSSRLK